MTVQAGPEAFFEEVCRCHRQAEAASSETTHCYYRLAGRVFRLCFAGPAMVSDYTRAFAHLACEPVDHPDFEVLLWDAQSTGVALPRLPWPADAYLPHGAVKGYNDERFRTTVFLDHGVLTMMDADARRAVYALRDARAAHIVFMASPLFQVMHWWLLREGLHVLHGSAVGTREGAALLVGKSGSGKSTSALACIDSELRYVSDDYCVVGFEGSGPVLYSLYNTAKLKPDNRHRFPHRVPAAVSPLDDKAIYFVHEESPERLELSLPLKAIVVPRVAGCAQTRTRPIGNGEVFKALAPSTLMQLPGTGPGSFSLLADLSHAVPGFALDAGPDLDQIPRALEALLADVCV